MTTFASRWTDPTKDCCALVALDERYQWMLPVCAMCLRATVPGDIEAWTWGRHEFDPEVVDACRQLDVPILSGALTPTEAVTAWDLGADVIKIFPAEFFGPAYIKSLRAPFPQIKFLPTGGVTPQTVGDFLKAGAFATAAGSALVSPVALKAHDWAAITARAREFVAAAKF